MAVVLPPPGATVQLSPQRTCHFQVGGPLAEDRNERTANGLVPHIFSISIGSGSARIGVGVRCPCGERASAPKGCRERVRSCDVPPWIRVRRSGRAEILASRGGRGGERHRHVSSRPGVGRSRCSNTMADKGCPPRVHNRLVPTSHHFPLIADKDRFDATAVSSPPGTACSTSGRRPHRIARWPPTGDTVLRAISPFPGPPSPE